MVDWQECVSIRPAECEHTETVEEFLFGIVVKTRQELDLLGVGTMIDGVIEDEDVDLIRTCQGSDDRLDDGGSERCCESTPVDMAGIHEAVERVLGKVDNTGLQVDLHKKERCVKTVENATRKMLRAGKLRSL